jgi:biopolymer transport protein TolR
MAMTSGGKGPQADINVTPLVDIVLVLLIIFMVITPMLNEGAEVNLPKAKNTETAGEDDEEPTTVSVTKEGEVWIGSDRTTLEDLETAMVVVIVDNGAKTPIVLKGDRETRYADMKAVMEVLEEVGAKNVRLQADQAKLSAEEKAARETPEG